MADDPCTSVVFTSALQIPKASCSLSLLGQQKVKKETTLVISRVTSAVQGSAPPMENFWALQSKKAEGSCEGSNKITSVTWEYELNLKGHPSVNYWICKKLSYPGSQVPLEIQNLNHGLCNIDNSHHLLNAHTSSFLTTLYLQEIKLLQN